MSGRLSMRRTGSSMAQRPSILPDRRLSTATIRPYPTSSENISPGTATSEDVDAHFERKCVLWIHDDTFSKEEVLFNQNLLPPGWKQGQLVGIVVLKTDASGREVVDSQSIRQDSTTPSIYSDQRSSTYDAEAEKQYLFTPKDMSKDMLAKHPKLEISVAKHVADVFGYKHRSNVLVTSRSAATVSATHVELSFRDVYLARSDMWRLTLSQLSNKTVYKGQKIVFMGTIKAQVTTVYVAGRKVQSAFFSTNTKPIFRSDSARYVLFIQMSREMWDFDSEGSGEIMFTKVVNGFLPALFKRWQALNSKHLVSMVLFTRVEYDIGMTNDIKGGVEDDPYFTGHESEGHRKPYKDFYRVVVSEMASGSWTEILFRLKKEFQDFRADITMYRLNNFVKTPTPPEVTDFALGSVPGTKIEAEPTFAIHGNLLEAINLATSQFSSDHIDRDLLRTGISIVVITPGAGLFDVDYERLKSTTDALIGSGIGIDLICLPKIPLHSVPLFRYRNPQYAAYQESLRMKAQGISSEMSTPRQTGTAYGSFSTQHESSFSPAKLSGSEVQRRLNKASQESPPDEYAYAIPHWLDVSFWTGASQELLSRHGALLAKDHRHRKGIVKPRKSFAVRCKMYEIEMLGNVENTEISVPLLPEHIRRLGKTNSSGSETSSLIKVPKKPFAGIADTMHGPTRHVVDKKSSQAEKDFFALLDTFDREAALVARPEPQSETTSKAERQKKIRIDDHNKPPKKLLLNEHTKLQRTPSVGSLSVKSSKSPEMVTGKKPARPIPDEPVQSATITARSPTPNPPTVKSMLPSLPFKMSRHISFNFRGFGISAPKAATPTLHTEHANAAPISGTAHASTHDKNSTSAMTSRLLSTPLPENGRPASSQGSIRSSKDSIRTQVSDKAISRPIAIKSHTSVEPTSQIQGRTMLGSAFTGSALAKGDDTVGVPSLQTIMSDDTVRTMTSKLLAKNVPDSNTLVPATAPSPWLKVLNPSNPTEANNFASQYKRWQHVFPKPVVTKAMKWKSLCSPAVVPLTTEFFPTKFQLDTEYQQKPYNISQNADDDLLEVPKTREEFLRELVGLRLAQGFQIVVGSAVAEAFGQKVMKIANAFENNHISEDGTSIFLSMGNLIHQLSCVNGTEVEINMFERKPTALIDPPKTEKQKEYKPAIKTHFDSDYVSNVVTLQEPVLEYNWNYVDSYIAGHEEDMTDRLKYWRARFVLIPVERPTVSYRAKGEDTEEETRLEGIKALTQIWQRHRVVPPSERRFQSVSNAKIGKRKDPNPLDIWYQTQDPSQVIAAELEGLPILDTESTAPRRGQLLSEAEHFRKANLNIAQLADAIQAPPDKGGVRMQNRRWHFRLHYNCFIGSDMTTWLMENFEDIETREEAVEFGNMLMIKDDDRRSAEHAPDSKEKSKDVGIFQHVEKRHPFRDGQFFYQIIGEFARPRPSGTGWAFAPRRRDASVPSIPGVEHPARESPKPERTRSSSNSMTMLSDTDVTSGSTTPTTTHTTKRPKVTLSNMIKFDVDPRKRSYRPERINLHYDRIHNPDSCYHIRLEWMNVTAKLIEDAIATWAVTADRYGLLLVEAPIAEAVDLANKNPFRRPYVLKLALRPPEQQPAVDFDPTSLVPTPRKEKFFYQKAILRRFNFVLDMEAASNFPSSVDVTYSWGRPDYKFCQYIHRSGRVFAQVTEEGEFILTVNKMFNNRSPQARERNMQDPTGERFGNDRQTAVQVQNQMLRERTPHSSPMLRATLGSPVLRASPAIRPSLLPPSGSSTSINNSAKPSNTNTNANGQGLGELAYGMERLKSELEDFCGDAEQLRAFYKEVLEKTLQGISVPPTPMGGKPRLVGGEREGAVDEEGIPEIDGGLGPSWMARGEGVAWGGGLGGGGGGSLRDGSAREQMQAWRTEGFGSLRAPPFRRGSEHASDAGSLGAQAVPGSPLVNVESGGSRGSEREKET